MCPGWLSTVKLLNLLLMLDALSSPLKVLIKHLQMYTRPLVHRSMSPGKLLPWDFANTLKAAGVPLEGNYQSLQKFVCVAIREIPK